MKLNKKQYTTIVSVININTIIVSVFITLTIVVLIYYIFISKPFTKDNVYDEMFLINLKRRPDRLINFLDFFNSSDFKNESINKFDAIDGTKLDINSVPLSELAKAELKQLENTGYRTKHYQLTKGAIGCYLSHVKIWEKIVNNNTDIALIFEDDAKVHPTLKQQINEEMINIPNNWDIVLFGYLCTKCYKHEKYNEVERFMLTHCYLIKRSALIKIFNTNTLFPITQQIDALMSELSSIVNIYTAKNKLIKQFGSRTDIQAPLKNNKDKNVHDRVKVLKNKHLI